MSWETSYDAWKTTPPDDPVSRIKCEMCGCEIYADESIYDIDGTQMCEGCATDWLDGQRATVTEEMAYGE